MPMATQVQTLTVLGKRKTSPPYRGILRAVATSNSSSSEQSDDYNPEKDSKPIIINGKISKYTKKRYQCTHTGCDKAYTKPSRLEEHERTHTGQRPYICETCKKAYLRESHLHAHTRSHLPEEHRPLACQIEGCGKRFWTSQHLKAHLDWHSGAKPFLCTHDSCTEAFSKHHQLRTHICQTHAPEGTKPYICDREGCSKSFNTNQHLKTHKKTHDPERYTCVYATCLATADQTPNYFPTWSALQTHIRKEHPPKCTYPDCQERTFASQKGLRAHLKLHEERDLESEMRRHIESDADDEPQPLSKKQRRGGEIGRDFKCDEDGCEKDFKSKKALDTHKKVTHLGRRDFACFECGKTFGYKHLLQRHTAKVHVSSDHMHDSTSDEESETPRPDQPAHTSKIDLITGKAYATRAESRMSRGRAFGCPFPDFDGILSSPLPGSSNHQPRCSACFTRLYDLRRHLESSHDVQVEKDDLTAWISARHGLEK
ncbi:transcription factor iiia [Coprinopsis marcescibilis]|uniref:Transcription factor iiia n=1 Tax=Coprinopsis marcescibilis TaxID=230819 RepID=A0A5C3KTA3_COPMA|nr:transcription factor iiia [Coprinopsis marcescibilis]